MTLRRPLAYAVAATLCLGVRSTNTPIEVPDRGRAPVDGGFVDLTPVTPFLPLVFEENRGQASADARFVARGPGYTVALGDTGAAVRLSGAATFQLALAGANAAPRLTAGKRAEGVSHYLVGNDPAKWRSDIPRYASVRYEQVYDGIDLVYYGNQKQLEHDFIVAAGADPARIAMHFPGAAAVRLDANCDLLLETGGEPARLQKPIAYQTRGSSRTEIPARFAIDERGHVGFALGDYDTSEPLVIDPILAYSTYAGGAGSDYAFGIAVDGSGNAYITGATDSSDFPVTTGAFDTSYNGTTQVPPNGDAFVLKLNPSGAVVYCTYVGGSDLDFANAIAVDSSGSAYITGRTISTNFPITPGVVQTQVGNAPFSSFGDMFVTKLDPSGSALAYSTYLAGYSLTIGYGIAVDSAGSAVVVGSAAFSFRTTNPLVTQPTAGFSDAFVAKLAPNAGSLEYATLIGGSNNDDGARSVALDADGNAYVTGTTFSNNLAVTSAAQSTYGGGGDTFVAKVSPTGTKLYVTYHGGNGFDSEPAIAADAAGNAYVTGTTSSTDFPVTAGALQTTKRAIGDAYVTKFNSSGSRVYSTHLGRDNADSGDAIVVGPAGTVFVLGRTQSSDFPTSSPMQATYAGSGDLFITQLNAAGSSILFSTFLGGGGNEEPGALAIDAAGDLYVAGISQSTNFPTLNPFQPTKSTGRDSIVARIRTIVPSMTLDKSALAFSAVSGGGSTTPQSVRLTQAGTGTVTWTATPSVSWLAVSPTSGSGSATLTISLVPGAIPPPGSHSGTIALAFTGASPVPSGIAVTLNVITTGTSIAPFGSFDTPVDGISGVNGSIAVTGWAIDDVEVTRVRILRDPVAGEGSSLIYIGDAVLVDGARPDVAALNPTAPRNSRGGWGYLLLTNFLPNLGNGTFRLVAIADDADGHSSVLGSKTITCNNSAAIAPFGAIDTPLQGETVSGTIADFGWVLSRGTRRSDPPNGGIVNVVIDGVVVGSPTGWVSRPDLSALFPASQFSGVDNALGIFPIDTTTLANGVHTIAWVVTDNLGEASGVGSRYFTVSNGSGVRLAPRQRGGLQSPGLKTGPTGEETIPTGEGLKGRRGFELDAPLQIFRPGADGQIVVHSEELDRIELHVGARVPNRLPIGAHYDQATGVFTWQPGVGFLGAHDFVFGRDRVRIVLNPKGSNRVGPQVVIDTPPGQRSVDGELTVAGWAADLDAQDGTGIDTIHVWAYPVQGGPSRGSNPIFVGVADLGGERPDVAAIYGQRYLKSGYGLTIRGLPAGQYDLAVFAYSAVKARFLPAKTVRAEIR